MGQCERFSEPTVSVKSILPERKNSDPLNGRWLANSDGDYFLEIWPSGTDDTSKVETVLYAALINYPVQ